MVKVLFIAGWLRSGTTVAGNVLGSTPGALHIGKLNYLWMKEHPACFECGCGRIIFDCPLWKPVFDQLEMTTEKRYEIRQLRRDSWRNDDVPSRYRDGKRGRLDLAYPRALGEFYGAVIYRTDASVVVDCTKNPSDASRGLPGSGHRPAPAARRAGPARGGVLRDAGEVPRL